MKKINVLVKIDEDISEFVLRVGNDTLTWDKISHEDRVRIVNAIGRGYYLFSRGINQ